MTHAEPCQCRGALKKVAHYIYAISKVHARSNKECPCKDCEVAEYVANALKTPCPCAAQQAEIDQLNLKLEMMALSGVREIPTAAILIERAEKAEAELEQAKQELAAAKVEISDVRGRLREATEGLARIAKGERLFNEDSAAEARMTLEFLCQPGKEYGSKLAAAEAKIKELEAERFQCAEDEPEMLHGLKARIALLEGAQKATAADLREKLAALCHEQWSGWMKYLFEKCEPCVDDGDEETGEQAIPCWAVERWKRQANTPYAALSDAEKDSDRKEADRILALLPSRPGTEGKP